jgi:hypothetical protein
MGALGRHLRDFIFQSFYLIDNIRFGICGNIFFELDEHEVLMKLFNVISLVSFRPYILLSS